MELFSTVLQLVALVLFVAGALLAFGWGGLLMAVAVDMVFVGVAIDRSQ